MAHQRPPDPPRKRGKKMKLAHLLTAVVLLGAVATTSTVEAHGGRGYRQGCYQPQRYYGYRPNYQAYRYSTGFYAPYAFGPTYGYYSPYPTCGYNGFSYSSPGFSFGLYRGF